MRYRIKLVRNFPAYADVDIEAATMDEAVDKALALAGREDEGETVNELCWNKDDDGLSAMAMSGEELGEDGNPVPFKLADDPFGEVSDAQAI